jgi:hypothetical protein
MGLFNDPNGWFKSAGEDVSNVVSGIGNAVSDIAHSDLGKAAAIAAAVYFGAPYLGLTGEAASAAAAADAAAVGGTAEGAAALSTAAQTAQSAGSLAGYAQTLGTTVSELGSGAAAALGKAGSYLSSINPATLAAGASLASGLIGAAGARQAASTAADASTNALALQKDIYGQQTALNAPYNAAGLTAQNKMLSLLGLSGNTAAPGYGQYAKDFSMADYQADPGYAFRLSEGMKQLGHQAGARGGLISGGTLKGLQDYAQNSASQEYQNAYNRYQTNRTNQLQPLGNLMSSGQAAANQQSGAAGTYGANAGNLITGAGNTAGAAQLGSATTLGNALNTGATAYQNQTNFNNWLAQNQNTSAYGPAQTVGGYQG